ncbi:alpha/beta fold hydrolase [Neobacillus sp. GCM10023253]|uniref:alpha/beta fold hydrolase n=1 Tax=Neobacillus sp. GCM10023253 TaxID=3252644 RepID=UPI0036097CEF
MNLKKHQLNESTLAYIDEGAGNPVVLLHGFCGSSQYWEKVIPELAKDYRVIAPDLPGHGQSSPLKPGFSIDDLAQKIKELLDALNIEKVSMFGHSLGGYITLAFAEKYNTHLTGFSLVHSTAFPDSDEAKKGREAGVTKIKDEGIHTFIDGLVPKLFSPEHLNESYVEKAKQIGCTTSPQGAMDTLLAMKNRPDRNHVLQNTEVPVILIAGEQDQIVPVEKTFSVSRTNIKQAIIKNAGHMSMYENPDELIKLITTFS